MKTIFEKIRSFAKTNKKTTYAILLVLIIGGYYGYKKMTDTSGETRYVMAEATKGTLISSVTGSGQVSATNEVEIKPKVSGDLVSINVKSGQTVQSGALLASLDATDALKAVRDAEVNLETAQLTYEKLVAPNDALSELQWENTLAKAKESKSSAEENLKKAYDDGFNDVSNAFLDLPTIMTGMNDLLYGMDRTLGGSVGQQNVDYYASYAQMNETVIGKAEQYKQDVNAKYADAKTSYDQTFLSYKKASRSSDTDTIEVLITQSYETTKKIADTVKSANNLLQLYKDQSVAKNITPKTMVDTHLATLSSYTAKTNSYLTSLLSSTNSITSNKTSIINATRTISENELSFQKFQAGADSLDIRNAKITITQKENTLSDARTTLSNYYLRAPFDGLVAKINAEKGDSVSSGTSIITLVTKQQIATLSMNEVDVAKIKVGQKATLTFDAVEDLTITGEVTEVDTIGTVTQGVATYNVKIAFDTQDERIKPGMTVSATIVIDVKTDALMVANSAIKTSADGTSSYIETFAAPLAGATDAQGAPSNTLPIEKTVTIGISNDTDTEILSGIKEGDLVVIRTTTAAQAAIKATATVSTRSLFGGRPGG
ncbi:MAG: HlyD family efflux transporter periplasmic adaptor subunit [Candidatus Parcubacteria bacterium]|nr:HlyD family efflux transporter periplasmic adaptor subunit [Candidatus Parcubacteria bacterium]